MSVMTIETKVTHKYLMNKTKEDLAYLYMDLLEEKINAENNRDRFMDHLNSIADALDLGWTDGDFPIEDVLSFIDAHSGWC
jgi:hypothetical protein